MEIENVSFVYDTVGASIETEALASITLDVSRGETCAIVGPSGCGKSTLLKILAGLLSPTYGDVKRHFDVVSASVGYVPQSANMLPWRSAIQNAAIGLELKDEALTVASKERLEAEFRTYGLYGFEDATWESLSGGMRQKVALICSLSISPTILLCDEPFSAIDFVTRLELLNVFKADCVKKEITTVFVTHNIEEAIFLADRVVVMSGRPGKIASIVDSRLKRMKHSFVGVRGTKEFDSMFREIWSLLDSPGT